MNLIPTPCYEPWNVQRAVRPLAILVLVLAVGCANAVGCGSRTKKLRERPEVPIPVKVAVPWEDQFNLYAQDERGWSILTPSADSRIMYVSSSEGNDATGAIYAPSDAEVGADPFNPAGMVQPFGTVAAALDQAREGYPDWVLLKRGDEWETSTAFDMRTGRSIDERSVLAYYGTAVARPLIRTAPQQPFPLPSSAAPSWG